MQRSSFHPQILLLATVCVVAVTISTAVSQHSTAIGRTYDLPTNKYFSIGGHILRIDTTTGQMFRLRGAANATQTGNTWAPRVPPVRGSHSGMLDITQLSPGSGDGVFLTDVAGSRTWLLKWRSNEVGEWFELRESQ